MKDIWPGREALLISIGTGSIPGKSFEGNLKDIALRVKETRHPDGTHGHEDMVDAKLLFRFNVSHGLEQVGLEGV